MLAAPWDPRAGAMLFDGVGLGLGMATAALRRLVQVHDTRTAGDLVAGTFRLVHLDLLGPDGVAAVVALIERAALREEQEEPPRSSFKKMLRIG